MSICLAQCHSVPLHDISCLLISTGVCTEEEPECSNHHGAYQYARVGDRGGRLSCDVNQTSLRLIVRRTFMSPQLLSVQYSVCEQVNYSSGICLISSWFLSIPYFPEIRPCLLSGLYGKAVFVIFYITYTKLYKLCFSVYKRKPCIVECHNVYYSIHPILYFQLSVRVKCVSYTLWLNQVAWQTMKPTLQIRTINDNQPVNYSICFIFFACA